MSTQLVELSDSQKRSLQLPFNYEYQRAILRVISYDELLILNLAINWSQGSCEPLFKTVDDFRYYLGLQDQCSYDTTYKRIKSLANKGFMKIKRNGHNFSIVVNFNTISNAILDNLAAANETLQLYIQDHKEHTQESKEKNFNKGYVPDMSVLNNFDYRNLSVNDLAQLLFKSGVDKDVAAYFALILTNYHAVAGEALDMNPVTWNTLKKSWNEVMGQVNPKQTIFNKVHNAYDAMICDRDRGLTKRYFAQYFNEASKEETMVSAVQISRLPCAERKVV